MIELTAILATGMEAPLIIGLFAASTAVSVGSSMYASKQSKDAAAYQNAQQQAAYAKTVAVQREQGRIQAIEKRSQIQSRYDAYKGAVATSDAERGVGDSRSTEQLGTALGIQAARESAKVSLEEQLGAQSFAISNMPQWQVGQSSSPFLAGIQGGLQGLQLGLSVTGSINQNALAQQQLKEVR
jgi:hypothetical protein